MKLSQLIKEELKPVKELVKKPIKEGDISKEEVPRFLYLGMTAEAVIGNTKERYMTVSYPKIGSGAHAIYLELFRSAKDTYGELYFKVSTRALKETSIKFIDGAYRFYFHRTNRTKLQLRKPLVVGYGYMKNRGITDLELKTFKEKPIDFPKMADISPSKTGSDETEKETNNKRQNKKVKI